MISTNNIMPTKVETLNINGLGTVFCITPGCDLFDVIFGKSHPKWDEMIVWCADTFEKDTWGTLPNRASSLMFRNKEDSTFFILRWGV